MSIDISIRFNNDLVLSRMAAKAIMDDGAFRVVSNNTQAVEVLRKYMQRIAVGEGLTFSEPNPALMLSQARRIRAAEAMTQMLAQNRANEACSLQTERIELAMLAVGLLESFLDNGNLSDDEQDAALMILGKLHQQENAIIGHVRNTALRQEMESDGSDLVWEIAPPNEVEAQGAPSSSQAAQGGGTDG